MNGQQDIWAQQAARAEARREIDFFRRQTDGELNYLLACHAAVSEVLTPELLYLLRDNFKRDIHGKPLNIPWMSISDLLLSNLCREIGYDTFELQPTVRKILYESLERDARFGKQRLLELSDFLLAYIRPLLMHQSPAQRREARRQRWVALSISHPELGAEEVAAEYQAYQEQGHRGGQGYIRRFLEKAPVRNTQLAVLERYVAGTNEWAKGHTEKAEEMLQGLGASLQFGEVRLEVPQTKPESPVEKEASPPDPPLKKERWGALESLKSEQLREAIYGLKIDADLGLIHLTNVNREEQRGQFWEFFDAMNEAPVQFYFLHGASRQLPSLFIERMVYELIQEELDDELSAVFFPTSPNGRLKIPAIKAVSTLQGEYKSGYRNYIHSFLLETFNIPKTVSLEQFLHTSITALPYEYIILPFELEEYFIRSFLLEDLAWIKGILSESNTGQKMPTLLFFFKKNDDIDINSYWGQLELTELANDIRESQNALIQIFDTVKEFNLIEWLASLGENNPAKREQLIHAFVESLPEKSQELYTAERSFDMVDIARLQELIYELHNQ